MVAAAALTALPLAEKGIQASVDLAKSLTAQVFDALRTPLVGWEQTETREKRNGTLLRTVRKANLPAWAAIVGGLVIAASMGRISVPGVTPALPGGPGPRPWWWPIVLPWPP